MRKHGSETLTGSISASPQILFMKEEPGGDFASFLDQWLRGDLDD